MNFMKRLRHDEHGLATVEAAIALPVLLLVLFGIMEGGLLILTKHQMDRASREAARYCSLYSTKAANCTKVNVDNIIDQTLTTTLLASKVTAVSTTANSPTAGVTTVKVSINGNFLPFTALVFNATIPLAASTSVVADW